MGEKRTFLLVITILFPEHSVPSATCPMLTTLPQSQMAKVWVLVQIISPSVQALCGGGLWTGLSSGLGLGVLGVLVG